MAAGDVGVAFAASCSFEKLYARVSCTSWINATNTFTANKL